MKIGKTLPTSKLGMPIYQLFLTTSHQSPSLLTADRLYVGIKQELSVRYISGKMYTIKPLPGELEKKRLILTSKLVRARIQTCGLR